MLKLKKLLKYVSENNEYYKRVIRDYEISDPTDITQYPILTRKELQENRFNMFSDGYKNRYFNQQLHRQFSSGTSGVPINVYWSYENWYASNLSLWRKRSAWYGIKPKDKSVIFTLNSFNKEYSAGEVYYAFENSNVLVVNVSLVYTEQQYVKLIHLINEYNPVWMYVQPFVLNKLLYVYDKQKESPPSGLKYIESVGEVLTESLRSRAISFFKVPLANMYGSEEMNGIAIEDSFEHMHILNDNVYVEVKRGSGIYTFGEGEAIITNLNNYAMPLIRYCQGDSILISVDSKNQNYIKSINGRVCESIKFGDYEITSSMLSEIIAYINNQLGDVIIESRYVYFKRNNELSCYVVLHENYSNWKNNITSLFFNVIKTKISSEIDIKINFIIENTISRKPGKNRILEIRE